MLRHLQKKAAKKPPVGFGWDGDGERKRDTGVTQGNFRSEALARAGLGGASQSEPILVKGAQKSRLTESSSRIDKSEVLSKEIRGKYPSTKRQFDKYVNDYALKQKEIDEIEQVGSVQRGASRERVVQVVGQHTDPATLGQGRSIRPAQKEFLLLGAASDQRANSFSTSAESDTRPAAGAVPSSYREDTENIAPVSAEEEREAMRVHNQQYYKRHPDCLATAAAVSLPTIKVEDRLEILKDTLRPGAADKFQVVVNAFLLLHRQEEQSTRPPSLASRHYQHDELCVCCANALHDFHITELGALLKLLALLAQNVENKSVLLRYGVVGTALKRMSKLPKAQKQSQKQSSDTLKLLASIMFQ
jgi:hypothetical protein